MSHVLRRMLRPSSAGTAAASLHLLFNLAAAALSVGVLPFQAEAMRRRRDGLRFAEEERAATDAMHERLLGHLRPALAVFMSGDAEAARRREAEKETFRELERAATERHVLRMRGGGPLEAGTLRLDVTRDPKRIEAHIAATAYGRPERQGGLRASRLAG